MWVCWPVMTTSSTPTLAELLVEARAVEGAVAALVGDDLPVPRRQLFDDLGARVARHGVLAPDLQLRVVGLVGVVREDDDPAVLARVVEQALERGDHVLRLRVGQLAVDEVLEHVDDDEGLHSSYPPS